MQRTVIDCVHRYCYHYCYQVRWQNLRNRLSTSLLLLLLRLLCTNSRTEDKSEEGGSEEEESLSSVMPPRPGPDQTQEEDEEKIKKTGRRRRRVSHLSRTQGMSWAKKKARTMRKRAWMFCSARFSALLPPSACTHTRTYTWHRQTDTRTDNFLVPIQTCVQMCKDRFFCTSIGLHTQTDRCETAKTNTCTDRQHPCRMYTHSDTSDALLCSAVFLGFQALELHCQYSL